MVITDYKTQTWKAYWSITKLLCKHYNCYKFLVIRTAFGFTDRKRMKYASVLTFTDSINK